LRTTLALVAVALSAAAPRVAPPVDPAPVIAAERAFAAKAAEAGVTASFLAFMADQAIVFSPQPVSAKALYGSQPPGKTPKEGGPLLAWWPNFAGVSRSGDLGFTTGPASVNGKPPGLFYFTIWARQADGGWKWVYDGGVQADGAAAPGPDAQPVALPPGDAQPMAPALAWAQVRAAEAALATGAARDCAEALKAALAPDARVQGSKAPPATTPAAVDRELATRAPSIAYRLVGGGAAKAGDLVWTWGDATWEKGGGAHFVRVWQRRAGKWSVVFDQIV